MMYGRMDVVFGGRVWWVLGVTKWVGRSSEIASGRSAPVRMRGSRVLVGLALRRRDLCPRREVEERGGDVDQLGMTPAMVLPSPRGSVAYARVEAQTRAASGGGGGDGSSKPTRRESSNCISFGGDFLEPNNDSNDQLSSVDGSGAKCGGVKVEEDARNMAFTFLAARAITVAELRKKLTGRKYSREVIDSVITYLQNRGLVNDELYAESFSRSHWLTHTWGPRRIKKALIEKGVSAEDADKATTRVFEDGAPSGSNQCEIPTMSQLSMDRLLTRASKQWRRYQNKSSEQRKSGMIRWLQYRGFDWTTINVILRKLGSDYSP